jgi:hypothetical protein
MILVSATTNRRDQGATFGPPLSFSGFSSDGRPWRAPRRSADLLFVPPVGEHGDDDAGGQRREGETEQDVGQGKHAASLLCPRGGGLIMKVQRSRRPRLIRRGGGPVPRALAMGEPNTDAVF